MTSEDIERLSQPPVVPLTWRQKIERVVVYAALVLSLVGIGFGVFAVNGVQAQQNCTNTNFAVRAAPADADRKAIDAMFASQFTFLSAAPTLTRAEEMTAYSTLLSAYSDYTQARAKDDAARAASPAGKC